MAQITNPEAVRFCNEVLRPLCEELRGLKVRIDAAEIAWNGGINNHFAAPADTVEDGREAEGVSRLTALMVSQAYGELNAVNPNAEIIQRPCVRQLP